MIELNDLVYDKSSFFNISFNFIDKKLIQNTNLLWKVNKKDFACFKKRK